MSAKPQNADSLWHLRSWLRHRDRKQADIIRDLGWDRARVSRLVTGDQPFSRDDIAALSAWLQIQPHELLMTPDEAISLRRLREAAHSIVDASTVSAAPTVNLVAHENTPDGLRRNRRRNGQSKP